MPQDFKLQIIEDVVIETDIIPGLNGLRINYNSSIGNKPDINNPDNLGLLAFEDAVQKAKLGTTIVDGGYLVTGMINASRIDTGTLNADRIATNSITASKLSATAIDGMVITGATVRTNNSLTPYVKMNSSGIFIYGQSLYFMDPSYDPTAGIWAESNGDLVISAYDMDYFGDINLAARGGMNLSCSGEVYLDPTSSLRLGGSTIEFEADIIPTVNDSRNIGSSSYKLNRVYTNRVYYGGSNYLAYNDANSISSNCNLVPSSSFIANLGSSGYRWGNVYTSNVDFAGDNAYLNYSGGFIQSNNQFRVVGSINLTGNLTFENNASITIGGRTYYQTTGAYDSSKYYLRS